MMENAVLLFDIDGTLTPARQPLPAAVGAALKVLRAPFHVAAGNSMKSLEPQFFRPLWECGMRRDFKAFVNNGASLYHCPFSQDYELQLQQEFRFRQHLGEADYATLQGTLREVPEREQFRLPSHIRVLGPNIADRVSMLSFTPIGHATGLATEEILRNRHEFVRFDHATGYRRRLRDWLRRQLSRMVAQKGLGILIGGETSLDIVVAGQDKTVAVKHLLDQGHEPVIFFGDALYPHGNDEVVLNFVHQWNQERPCPVIATPVRNWEHTLQLLRTGEWLHTA